MRMTKNSQAFRCGHLSSLVLQNQRAGKEQHQQAKKVKGKKNFEKFCMCCHVTASEDKDEMLSEPVRLQEGNLLFYEPS